MFHAIKLLVVFSKEEFFADRGIPYRKLMTVALTKLTKIQKGTTQSQNIQALYFNIRKFRVQIISRIGMYEKAQQRDDGSSEKILTFCHSRLTEITFTLIHKLSESTEYQIGNFAS